MVRIYFTLLAILLVASSCQPQESITPVDSLVTLHLPNAERMSQFKVAISDLEGNILETRPVTESITYLGTQIPHSERPEHFHLHLIRELNISGDHDHIQVQSFVELEKGSAFLIDNFWRRSDYTREKLNLELFTGTSELSTKGFMYENLSTGLQNAKLSYLRRQQSPKGKVYTGSISYALEKPTNLFAYFESKGRSSEYYWYFEENIPQDSHSIELANFSTTTTPIEVALPGEVESANIEVDGIKDGLPFTFNRKIAEYGDPLVYELPENIFDQYFTKISWKDLKGKAYSLEKTTNTPLHTISTPPIDLNLENEDIHAFDFSSSGKMDIVEAVWYKLIKDPTHNTIKEFKWSVFSPANPISKPVRMPTISKTWLPDSSWPLDPNLTLLSLKGKDRSDWDFYEQGVRYELNQRLHSFTYEKPKAGGYMHEVSAVIR